MDGEREDAVDVLNGRGVLIRYPRFHEVMTPKRATTAAAPIAHHSLVPGLKEDLEAGIDVLDVGCGSGQAMIELAKAYPNSRFAGYDFSEEGISRANAEAKGLGLANVRFDVRDAAAIGETEAYDLITSFDAIHDQAKPAAACRIAQGFADGLSDSTFRFRT